MTVSGNFSAILKIDVEVDFSIVILMTTYKALQN